MTVPLDKRHTDNLLTHEVITTCLKKQESAALLAFLNTATRCEWRLFEVSDEPSTFLSQTPPAYLTIQVQPEQIPRLLQAWLARRWEPVQPYDCCIPLEAPQQPGRLLGLLVATPAPSPDMVPLLATCETLLTSMLFQAQLMALAQPVEQAMLAWITHPDKHLDEQTVKRYANFLRVDIRQRHLVALLSLSSPSAYRQLANAIKQRYPGSLVSWDQTLLAWLDLATSSCEEVLWWFQQEAVRFQQQNITLHGGISLETVQVPCHASYQEAWQAWNEAKKQEMGGVLAANHLGIRRFVVLSPDLQEDPHYQFIARLSQHDPGGTRLATLREYLNFRNIAQAARALNTPETTIRSRLRAMQQIAEDFHINLEAPHWLDLSLALLLYEQSQTFPFPR
jgi:sugar diacid utilization regulator